MWNVYANQRVNIPYDKTIKWMDEPVGPLFNFVGLKGATQRSGTPPYGWVIDLFNTRGVANKNLHLSMLHIRLGLTLFKQVAPAPLPLAGGAPELEQHRQHHHHLDHAGGHPHSWQHVDWQSGGGGGMCEL